MAAIVLELLGDFLGGAQTASADVELERAAVHLDGVALDVGPPHALGARRTERPASTMLVLDVLSELRAFAADVTFPAQFRLILLLSSRGPTRGPAYCIS